MAEKIGKSGRNVAEFGGSCLLGNSEKEKSQTLEIGVRDRSRMTDGVRGEW